MNAAILLLPLLVACGDYDEEGGVHGASGDGDDTAAAAGGEGAEDDGGGISPEAYATAYADALCDWAQQCQRLAGFGGTRPQCVELVRGTTTQLLAAPECIYSAEAADQCLDALASQPCDAADTPPVCDLVCGG